MLWKVIGQTPHAGKQKAPTNVFTSVEAISRKDISAEFRRKRASSLDSIDFDSHTFMNDCQGTVAASMPPIGLNADWLDVIGLCVTRSFHQGSLDNEPGESENESAIRLGDEARSTLFRVNRPHD